MTIYVKENSDGTLEYPYSLTKMKADNPRTSFSQPLQSSSLSRYGVYEVADADQPTYDPLTERVVEIDPAIVGGQYTQRWSIEALSDTQKGAKVQERFAEIKAAVQDRLDSFAQTRDYNSILSASTYATSAVTQFAADGQYCVTARDDTWGALYQMLNDYEAGNIDLPTVDEALAQLPELAWPA